jgi:signal transduction histidine kinase
LAEPGAGRYDQIHRRYHPTFHRYRAAFGFYDIFLIGRPEGRVLYTVMKEIDLGAALLGEPYRSTGLARVYGRARELDADEESVMEDYSPYVASGFAPAAFVAAPVRRAGAVAGVLAIQVSIEEVNRVMNADGLGETGEAYIIGPDNMLRSDFRHSLERPEPGIPAEVIERIRRNGTAVAAFPVNLDVVERIREGQSGTELGVNVRGARVLRSHAPLQIAGLEWAIIAEMELSEALAPVTALRNRILTLGAAVAVVFFGAAGWLAASVTRPVRRLAAAARRLGQGDLGSRVPVDSRDEIGQLAADFNRMSEDLQKTTVSKHELEILAGRLITAQEDERRRVARELHDDLSQRLAAVAIEAGRLERGSNGASPAAMERVKEHISRIAQDIHGLSRRLHPAMLDDLGLAAAIEAECRSLLERGGPPVNVRFQGPLDDIGRDVQLAVYRIVQEALRNIQRHSGADEVDLLVSRTAEGLELKIRDNGQGFDRNQPGWRGGLGIASMEERARLLGGWFRISSNAGEGTLLEGAFPLRQSHEETESSVSGRS